MAYYVNFIRIFFVFVLFNYSFLIARAYMWTNNGEDWGDRNNWGPPQQCVVGLPCYPHQRGDLAYFNVSTSALEVAVNVNGSFNLSNMVFDESRSDHTKYRIYPEASSLCNLIFRTNVDLPPGSTISNSYLKSAFSGDVDISCPLIMSNFENATDDSPNSLVVDCSKPDARINILGTLSQEYFVSPYLDLGLVKVGPGTLYLANNANNFKRGVRILNGQITAQTILDSGFECSLGYGSAILLSINGAYSFDPVNLNPAFYNYPLSVAAASKLMIHSLSEQQTNRNIFLSGAGMLGNLSTDHKVVFTGSINNLSNAVPASLVIQGPGIVELRGENIYSGTTVVDMGSILFTRRASPSSLPPIPEASNVVIRNGVFDPTCGGNSVDSYRFKSLTQYGGEFTLIDQIDLGQVGDENISARTTFKSTTYNDFFPTVFFTYYSTFDNPFFPFNARISTEGLMDITSAELIVYFLEDDPAPSSKVFTILQARDFIRPLPSLIKSNYNKNAHGWQQLWYQNVQKSDKV
jgi:autotransporter-associated beta strand protein